MFKSISAKYLACLSVKRELLYMIKIDAPLLYWMVTLLEQMKVSCRRQAEIKVVKEVHRKEFLRHLELARNYAEKLALPLTQKQVDRLAKDIGKIRVPMKESWPVSPI